jgi:hypothetical protein
VKRDHDFLRRLGAEARQRRDGLERRVLHALQAAERVKQLAPATLADAGNSQQLRGDRARGAARSLEGDRESVRLISRLLEQAQRR